MHCEDNLKKYDMGEDVESPDCDTEMLIAEVETRPILWDMSSEDYKDRSKRKAAWDDLARIFTPGFDGMTDNQRSEIGKKFSSKWKNIRDAFVRVIKAENDNLGGSQGRKKRRYIYHEQLHFLKDSLTQKQAVQNLSHIAQIVDDGLQQTQNETDSPAPALNQPGDPQPPDPLSRRRQRKMDILKKKSFEEKLMSVLQTTETDDGDTEFFTSLLPMIKNFDDDQRLEFRSELLNLVKRVKFRDGPGASGPPMNPPPNFAPYPPHMQFIPPHLHMWPPNPQLFYPGNDFRHPNVLHRNKLPHRPVPPQPTRRSREEFPVNLPQTSTKRGVRTRKKVVEEQRCDSPDLYTTSNSSNQSEEDDYSIFSDT